MRVALEEGRDFADTANQLEADFTPNLTISRVDKDVDAAVLDAIFRAKKPSPGNARLGSTVTTTGNYAVFTVNAVFPGRPESIPLEERDRRKEELQNSAGATDYIAFVSGLVENANVTRNEDVLTAQDFL
jgi:hypothetical protein